MKYSKKQAKKKEKKLGHTTNQNQTSTAAPKNKALSGQELLDSIRIYPPVKIDGYTYAY